MASGLQREPTRRFHFRVPPRWRSPILENPFAADAERRVIQWFEELGCTPSEVARAQKFDAAGYVGIPFPSLSRHKTLRIAKYLSLWLLWDDVEVETLESRWKIEADHVLSDLRPERMSRFDEGWWQLLSELAVERSPAWIERLCQAMAIWNAAAVEEAVVTKTHRERGELVSFDRQMELRIATIGMYATVHLLDDAHDHERPRELYDHPTVRRIETLAGQIVGLGNDLLSLGKDCAEDQCNLVTTLMRERGISIDDAIEQLVHMHDEALEELDTLGDALERGAGAAAPYVARWLQDLRYASLGFSLWESQAPRYTAHKIVVAGQIIEPQFSFFPPSRPSPPSSRRFVAPPSSRRLGPPPSGRRAAMVSGLNFPEDT
jgi:terpene synthase-like protein